MIYRCKHVIYRERAPVPPKAGPECHVRSPPVHYNLRRYTIRYTLEWHLRQAVPDRGERDSCARAVEAILRPSQTAELEPRVLVQPFEPSLLVKHSVTEGTFPCCPSHTKTRIHVRSRGRSFFQLEWFSLLVLAVLGTVVARAQIHRFRSRSAVWGRGLSNRQGAELGIRYTQYRPALQLSYFGTRVYFLSRVEVGTFPNY